MLVILPILLSCVSASFIPLIGRDDASLTNVGAGSGDNRLTDPFDIRSSKRDNFPFIGPNVGNALSDSIDDVLHFAHVNTTAILNDIESSINSQLSDLQQDLQFLDPGHIFQVIETAVSNLPSEFNQFKNQLTSAIQSAVGNLFGIHPSKRDGLFTIPNDVISTIANTIENTLHLPHVNTTEILHDIESSINSQLNDLQQDLQFLDPGHIFQVIETAVSNLPSEFNQFKNQLTSAIQSAVGNLFGIHPSKRDGLFTIPNDVISTIANTIENTLHLPHVNTTAILHDIESSINSQLNDLQQDLQFLDPGHIFQVIETAVSNLPSEFNQFKNQLTSAIQSAVGNLFGIHPSSKRDGLFTIPNDVISTIANTIENTLHLPHVNTTAILHDIESSINSQLNDLQQDLQFLDPGHIFQVIETAVSNLPSEFNQFKNQLTSAIQSAVGNLFGIHPSSKRDGLFTIPNDVISTIANTIENTLHLPHVNTTAILHDIESSINSQLNDLQQDLQFLDPGHIFQVIETAVSNLPSEFNQFKNQLTSAIQSAVGNLLGIHPSSKRDGSFAVPSDIVDSIAGTVESTLHLPSVNNTQILHHVEASINSQLSELHQAIGTLDSSQLSQIIQKAVSSLPSTVNQFKNSLVQSIQNAISNFFPNLQ